MLVVFIDFVKNLKKKSNIRSSLWVLLYLIFLEMLGVSNFLPRDGYQDNVELIHLRWSKKLIKRNAMGTNK
jgi:hypothetical protein